MTENWRRQSKIKPLNDQIAQEIKAKSAEREAFSQHYDRAHAVRRNRIVLVGVLVASVFLVQLVLGQVRLHAANQTLSKSETQLASVQKESNSLHKTAKQLQDPAYLQQILRDKYGYSRKDEIIYNLPNQS